MTTSDNRTFVWSLVLPGAALAGVIVVAMTFMLQFAFREHIPGSLDVGGFTLENFARIVRPVYLRAIWDTMLFGLACAVLDLLLGYPIALALIRSNSPWLKSAILIITLMPLFAGDIVRTYGWLVVLGKYGIVNTLAQGIGLSSEPLKLLYTPLGVTIAMVHYAMPVMVLILATSLSHIDRTVEKAARSLGASPIITFFSVTLPLSLPGIVSGVLTIFTWSLSAFAVPQIIGGGKVQTIPTLIYGVGFSNFNFPLAATLSLASLVMIGLFLTIGNIVARRYRAREH